MRAAEREPVLDLLEYSFEEHDLFARYIDFDPAYDPSDFLLALDGARPVSCVQVFTKTIRLRGQAIGLGGIGSVATDPDYRKRGLAFELLRRSEERMRERGLVLGLLFAVLWDFYSRLGWVQIPARQLALHRQPEPAAAPPDVALRAFRADDLAQVQALYERYTSDFEGTTIRDADYWRGQLRYAGSPGEDFRVAERDGRIVAYARTAVVQVPMALEFAHEPSCGNALASLLLGLCPDEGALLMRLPPGTELEGELAARAAALDRVDDPTLMWRVLDGGALAQLVGRPAASDERELLAELIEKPPAHYWVSDRF